MHHYFIVNPAAGKESAEGILSRKLSFYNGQFDYHVFLSKKTEDTELYIQYVRSHQSGHLRFISCGGDGTLNKVVNAVQGMKDVSVGCYASGSGNDYIKYFGQVKDFLDLGSLFAAREASVDIMRIGDRVAVNMVHFGFDSKVAEGVERFRRWPVLGGKHAYNSGVAAAILSPMFTTCTVLADGTPLGNSKILLCTLACGQYVGGGFRCAPKSSNDDGLIDICLVKPLSRFRLVKMMSAYKQGLHLEDERLRDVIVYRRTKKVQIQAPRFIKILLDGEITSFKEAYVEIMPKALQFAIPKNL